MRNNSNKNKGFISNEIEQHTRLYDELTGIKDKVARHAIAGEIIKDMQDFDIGV